MARKKFNEASTPRQKKLYYTISEPQGSDEHGWEVVFMTSDKHREVNINGGTPGKAVMKAVFAKFYGDKADDLGLRFEEAENGHVAYCNTLEEAKQRMAEIVYVLNASGFKPCAGEKVHKTVTPQAPKL